MESFGNNNTKYNVEYHNTYQSDAICLGRRVHADEDEIRLIDAFVDVCAKVKILASTLFDHFLQARLEKKIIVDMLLNYITS